MQTPLLSLAQVPVTVLRGWFTALVRVQSAEAEHWMQREPSQRPVAHSSFTRQDAWAQVPAVVSAQVALLGQVPRESVASQGTHVEVEEQA